ncbi:hypothetical protein [Achromobacter sp. AONIH1]|uniref:putative PDDEXK endonuclease n=1 Tax=Achromobacter sp. AONIH1 TaxID=1758194 RepID=UPI001F3AEA6D|nr:hypothetical protein [Achromobacter sp. AONIH1]
MSAMQRNKGAAYERKIANLLTADTGTTWRRRVRNQAGDSDVVADDPAFARISVECKHADELRLAKWWRQTLDQAGELGIPVLIYRKTGALGESVMVDAYHVNARHWPAPGRYTVTMDWPAAMQWLREMLPATNVAPGYI